MYTTLIEATELKSLLATNSDICIFDCRFSLADTAAGKRQWEQSHIARAHYADLDNNLSSNVTPGITGRHPLPEPQVFVDWLATHGVNHDTQIIAYDSASGAIACRLWWLCKWIGHESCAVLNGGLNAWEPVVGTTDSERTTISGNGNIVRQSALVKSLKTHDVINHKEALLVDAREYPRYLGEQEPIDPVAGHIPGAVSYPFLENLDNNGKFIDRKALQLRFSLLHEQAQQKELIMYCGSGVTAIHNILAMDVADFTLPTLYEDSWSGWILDPKRKISCGDTTK